MRNMSIASLLTYAERNQKRIYRAIEKYNSYESNKTKIKTVGDLIFSSHLELFKMENMGEKSINELCNALRKASGELGFLSPEQLRYSGKIEYLWSLLRERLEEETSETLRQICKIKNEVNINKHDYLRVAKQLEAMTERYDELVQSQNQQATLDQFAMAALPILASKGYLSGAGLASAAYDIAEAMQAESQRRQGGAA